jgi:hypothetical protein
MALTKINRQFTATIFAYATAVLTAALGFCLALYILGTTKSTELKRAMDVPMAISFWTYLVLNPIAGGLALWFGSLTPRTKVTTKILLWIWAIFLSIMVFPPVLGFFGL